MGMRIAMGKLFDIPDCLPKTILKSAESEMSNAMIDKYEFEKKLEQLKAESKPTDEIEYHILILSKLIRMIDLQVRIRAYEYTI